MADAGPRRRLPGAVCRQRLVGLGARRPPQRAGTGRPGLVVGLVRRGNGIHARLVLRSIPLHHRAGPRDRQRAGRHRADVVCAVLDRLRDGLPHPVASPDAERAGRLAGARADRVAGRDDRDRIRPRRRPVFRVRSEGVDHAEDRRRLVRRNPARLCRLDGGVLHHHPAFPGAVPATTPPGAKPRSGHGRAHAHRHLRRRPRIQLLFGHPIETRAVAFFAMGLPVVVALAAWWQWQQADRSPTA